MLLKQVHINNFRHMVDSTVTNIEPDVTCLVGKNESGKSTFLHALHRVKPANGKPVFNVLEHYPAWLEKRHRREGRELEEQVVIKVTFELEEEDVAALAERFGTGTFESMTFSVQTKYDGSSVYSFSTNESKAVAHVLSTAEVPHGHKTALNKIKTFADLSAEIEKIEEAAPEEAPVDFSEIEEAVAGILGKSKDMRKEILAVLSKRMPGFFYFSNYATLPYSVEIKSLLAADKKTLDENGRTARALLEMAGADTDYLVNPDYETRKRELENVANAITQDVLAYWSTNTQIRVMIDITQKTNNLPNGQTAVVDELKTRIYDDRHKLSLPFDERSTGFQWFFSFLAAFSEFQYGKEKVIILLDEPGLGLHARAQKDILKYIDEKLAPKCQVIFTTHSPFLVQTDKIERARLVEDKGTEIGSKVTSDVLTTDKDTLFPLQSALGYDIAQHLFIGAHNLVVEGSSDFTYMTIVSDHLRDLKREYLSEKWSIVPVGSADSIPTFVALLGNHLNVTILVDSQKQGHQRLQRLASDGYIQNDKLIMVGAITGQKEADIEDLFEPEEYLGLYNEGFGKKLKVTDLQGNDRIISRIERAEKIEKFFHGKPAEMLLRKRDVIVPKLSEATLARFEKLFTIINKTL